MNVTCPHCGAPRTGPSCPYCGVVFEGSGPSASPQGLPAGVWEALSAGKKIDAIRLYHKAKGCSLLEAKQAVEALEARLPRR